MSNSIEHIIPEHIVELVGLESGEPDDNTWFRVNGILGTGEDEYYPSIKGGVQLKYDDPEYWVYKTKKKRWCIRLSVTGNSVAAEGHLRDHFMNVYPNHKCLNTGRGILDIYVPFVLEEIN